MDVREKMVELVKRAIIDWEHGDASEWIADHLIANGVTVQENTAADVAPVRHGRWVDKPLIKSFKHTNIPVVECSACGIDFCDIINNHYFMYKYCPNCGAKMDGELNE